MFPNKKNRSQDVSIYKKIHCIKNVTNTKFYVFQSKKYAFSKPKKSANLLEKRRKIKARNSKSSGKTENLVKNYQSSKFFAIFMFLLSK